MKTTKNLTLVSSLLLVLFPALGVAQAVVGIEGPDRRQEILLESASAPEIVKILAIDEQGHALPDLTPDLRAKNQVVLTNNFVVDAEEPVLAGDHILRGALYNAGQTTVSVHFKVGEAVNLSPGDTLSISAAAGGCSCRCKCAGRFTWADDVNCSFDCDDLNGTKCFNNEWEEGTASSCEMFIIPM